METMLRYNQNNPFRFEKRGDLEEENTFSFNQEKAVFPSSKNGMTENFLWDGLALIHRGTTSFINEPYVTGGNPILSTNDGVMFNDMLGNTIATKNDTLNKINMTAFGETDDKSAFFTGKPNIGELGYAFLFRNYRADQGKWQTSDPLGYPDGWNNLAYVNNGVINKIDFLGAKVYAVSRDLALSPVGNHQYLAFVPDNPNDFNDELQDLGGGNQGFTFGGQEGSDGKLVTDPNNKADIKALNEYFNPGSGSWWKPDFDAELREIPTPAGMTDTEFTKQLQNIIKQYKDNSIYELNKNDCATWLNTMLYKAGFPEEYRRALLDFFGADGGYKYLIDDQYFE